MITLGGAVLIKRVFVRLLSEMGWLLGWPGAKEDCAFEPLRVI